MGTLNALYVRAKGALIESTVRKIFPDAKIQAGRDFTGFTLPADSFNPPQENLSTLSKECDTDLIWLGFQSAADAFQFHHWRAGSLLRSLVFGCHSEGRAWDQAEGQPEPWERTAFFDPKCLEPSLKFARSDDEKCELERIWREAELAPDRLEPRINARESARKVAKYYHLPGWC